MHIGVSSLSLYVYNNAGSHIIHCNKPSNKIDWLYALPSDCGRLMHITFKCIDKMNVKLNYNFDTLPTFVQSYSGIIKEICDKSRKDL